MLGPPGLFHEHHCPRTVGTLLERRESAIRAARALGPGTISLEAHQTWKRAKAHRTPVARYMGKGTFGAEIPGEELEAENAWAKNPS